MTTDSFFAVMCGGMIALLFGLALCFAGYRLFLFLLPIWAFIFGFGLGAQTVQVIFGEAFLATVTSWVVGFIVAAIFAVLAYLFYIVGVAFVGGALGYAIGVGLMGLIGFDPGFITWLVGIILGVVMKPGSKPIRPCTPTSCRSKRAMELSYREALNQGYARGDAPRPAHLSDRRRRRLLSRRL